jgi:hypothetical protein
MINDYQQHRMHCLALWQFQSRQNLIFESPFLIFAKLSCNWNAAKFLILFSVNYNEFQGQ